jgi:hypothetical protein
VGGRRAVRHDGVGVVGWGGDGAGEGAVPRWHFFLSSDVESGKGGARKKMNRRTCICTVGS